VGLFQRLSDGLAKTRAKVQGSFDRLLRRGPDEETLEELEAELIGADLGVHTVGRLMERVRAQARGVHAGSPEQSAAVSRLLKETILEQLRTAEGEPIERLLARGPRPFVVLAVGVNGVGKTTTLAKLAQRLKEAGYRPLLVAADTFRAAAIEQLEVWGRRVGVEVVRHQHGADPSAVVFDGVAAARSRGARTHQQRSRSPPRTEHETRYRRRRGLPAG